MSSTNLITANHPTEARPYAKAVFEFAKENKVLAQWQQLLVLAGRVIENEDMQALLSSPKFMADQKANFVIEVFKALQESLTPAQENFIRLLAQNGRFGLLPSIYFLYQTYLAAFNKVASVKVTTAFPIESDQQARLEKALEKKLQCKVAISYEEDKALLGGALVSIGDEVIDSSIKGRLTQLKSALLED